MQLGFEMYDVTRLVMSPMSDSLPPFPTLLMRPAQPSSSADSLSVQHPGLTRKVTEGQISNVAPPDLQTHTVSGERQLRGGWILVSAVQEMRRARARVEGSALRSSDALLYLRFLEDDVTKGFVARGTERLAAGVGDEAE